MKKKEFVIICVLALLLMVASYEIDNQINSLVQLNRNAALDIFFTIITNAAIVGIIFFLAPVAFIYYKKRKIEVSYFLSLAFSLSINLIIKLLAQRNRPNGIIEYRFLDIIDYSFPSSHTMIAFAMLPVNFESFPRQKYYFLAYALLVGASRIYLGVHYLSDVVSGAFFGLVIGYVILLVSKKGKNGK